MKEVSLKQVQQSITYLNPHWESGRIDDDYHSKKPRKYFDLFFPLANQFDVTRAIILMGPRRVGKTVLLWHTIQRFIDEGHAPQDLLYLSLDTPLIHQFSLEQLLELYKTIHSLEKVDNAIIIFDEIQYLKDWDIHLKVLVDRYRRIKFIASGSAAGALQRKSKESGAGRFTDFFLPPVTFFEYLELLGLTDQMIIQKNKRSFSPKNIQALNKEFINYLNYGGFPEAIFNEAIRNNPQRFIRSDIIDKVLLRDLPSLYGIQDTQELNRFFMTLVYQTGNEVSLEGLSQASNVAKNTIKRYLEYLEAAFLIKRVKRIDDSGKLFKRANYFKVYLTNPSIYSAIYGNVLEEDNQTVSCLVETALFSQWMHNPDSIKNLFYARWKSGKGEVDMVYLNERFVPLWCLEVKWSDKAVQNFDRLQNLIYFCRKHPNLETITVTTKAKRAIQSIDGFEIKFVEAAVQCWTVGGGLLAEPLSDVLCSERPTALHHNNNGC